MELALNGGLACRKTRVFGGNSNLFDGGKNSAGPLTPVWWRNHNLITRTPLL